VFGVLDTAAKNVSCWNFLEGFLTVLSLRNMQLWDRQVVRKDLQWVESI